jgi:hypothetical protein
MLGAKQLIDVLDAVAVEAVKHSPKLSRGAQEWLRVYAPYAFHRLPTGRFLAVNRAYKPLGLQEDASGVECDCFEHLAVPRDRLDLVPSVCGSPKAVYLYTEDTAPYRSRAHLRTYARRLAAVLRTRPAVAPRRAAA